MTEQTVNHTNLPIGEILRRARLEHRLSLDDVETHTRIRATYIDALERNDFERIPGKVYITGFIRAYADYIGLDADKMVQLLKSQTGHKVTRAVNIFPVVSEDQKVPNKRIIIISAAILFVIFLIWKLDGPAADNDEIPAVPNELTRQMTAPQKPDEDQKPDAQAAVEESKTKPHPVVLKAVQDVWLEIRDNTGQPIFSRVLKKGEEYWVPEEAVGYKMTTGNSGGLEMIVEGITFPTMGRTGEVRRNISLNPVDLKALVPAKPK